MSAIREKIVLARTICCAIILLSHYALSDDFKNVRLFSAVSEAAEKGDSTAQFMLGSSYYEGNNGLGKDYKKAFYWFMKAAKLNNTLAQQSISGCFLYGHGVEKDEKEAFFWMQKAALLGNISAQGGLGVYYSLGVGVEKNEKEAFKWYLKAAEGGSQTYQFAVGEYYEKGEAVNRSMSEAIKWYQKAADKGYSEAIEKLKNIKQNEE